MIKPLPPWSNIPTQRQTEPMGMSPAIRELASKFLIEGRYESPKWNIITRKLCGLYKRIPHSNSEMIRFNRRMCEYLYESVLAWNKILTLEAIEYLNNVHKNHAHPLTPQ